MPAPSQSHAPRAPGPPAPPHTILPEQHLSWARMIARAVRARYGFRTSGQEEEDLIAAAYLCVCELAVRFDALTSYRRGAERAILRAARAWRPGRPRPSRAGAVDFGGRCQRLWAIGVVRPVVEARGYAVGTARRRALFGVALSIAAECAGRFDAVGAFRGWASIEVRSRCQREAVRLRNGGTFNTTRRPNEVTFQVFALPGQTCHEDADGDLHEPDVPEQLLLRYPEWE